MSTVLIHGASLAIDAVFYDEVALHTSDTVAPLPAAAAVCVTTAVQCGFIVIAFCSIEQQQPSSFTSASSPPPPPPPPPPLQHSFYPRLVLYGQVV